MMEGEEMGEVINAYKGFNKDMTCTPAGVVFQYEEGKEYETENVNVCHEGFHACEYPLDVFGYYAPASSVFHEVELSGKVDRDGDGNKVASSKIKIGASINIAGIVKAAIEYTNARVEKRRTKHNTGYRGALKIQSKILGK